MRKARGEQAVLCGDMRFDLEFVRRLKCQTPHVEKIRDSRRFRAGSVVKEESSIGTSLQHASPGTDTTIPGYQQESRASMQL